MKGASVSTNETQKETIAGLYHRVASASGAGSNRAGGHSVLPRAPGALQVPRSRGVRRSAQDLDWENTEVRAA